MFHAVFGFTALILVTGIASTSAADAADSRLKTITGKKTIAIAYRPDAAPFSFVKEEKEPIGYTIDICKAVVTSLEKKLNITGLKIQWVPVTAQSRFEVVAGGKADLECGSSTVTLSRMKQVDFSSVVFVESTGLVVKSASGVSGLKDMVGKKIAVIAGTSNEKVVAARSEQLQLNATIVRVKDRDEAVNALENGTADAFANDKLLLIGTRFKDSQALRMLPDDLSIESYAIVLPRGDWELRLAVNTALAQIYRSGEVRTIFNNWFSSIGAQPSLLLEATYALGALSE
jgi:glutamate/aspartate transport system substrate-binding protein